MMAQRRRAMLVILTMVLGLTTLAALWRPLREAGGFFVPDRNEAKAARALFDDALAGKNAAGLGQAASALGLEAKRLDAPSGLAFSDVGEACAGRGAYVMRAGPQAMPVAVMAPHRGFDKGTGDIARALFTETAIAAAAWNTAPRHATRDCRNAGDVTRIETHYFTAFSQSFAGRYRHGRVVQLHGFDPDRQGDVAAREADAIISDGSEHPSARLLDLADCLSRLFPQRRIKVYPVDTRVLGGTINRQGRALHATGFEGFAHIELGPDLRRVLAGDAAARADFARCLGTGL